VTEAELIAVAATRISERPAVPKEIFILDKMPLTDVGKPIKAALRRDAAERAFRSALSALRVPSEDVRIAIEPDPMHNFLLTISVRSPGASRAGLAADIDAIMGQYSFAYAVTWTGAEGTAP
jgi:fatty-acyl-CoA synthase